MGQGYKAVLEKNDVLWNVSVWEIQEVLFSSFLPVNKKVETKKKRADQQKQANEYSSFPPCLSSRARTDRVYSKLDTASSLIKCVLGRKNCFISTNPAGLPGGPPTLSTSIAFIC